MQTHHEDTAVEILGEYRWRSFEPHSLELFDGTAQEAADAMGLDPTEIEWAVEEFGRCDTPKFVCWKPGEPEGEWGEEISGGYEWPASEAKSDGTE